jgi:hypothetical protein
VGVGEDVALAIDNEARAGGLALLLRAEAERRFDLLHDLGSDVDHAGGVAPVDLAGRHPLPAASGGRPRRQRRLLDDGRGLRLVADADQQQHAGHHGSAEHGGQQRIAKRGEAHPVPECGRQR